MSFLTIFLLFLVAAAARLAGAAQTEENPWPGVKSAIPRASEYSHESFVDAPYGLTCPISVALWRAYAFPTPALAGSLQYRMIASSSLQLFDFGSPEKCEYIIDTVRREPVSGLTQYCLVDLTFDPELLPPAFRNSSALFSSLGENRLLLAACLPFACSEEEISAQLSDFGMWQPPPVSWLFQAAIPSKSIARCGPQQDERNSQQWRTPQAIALITILSLLGFLVVISSSVDCFSSSSFALFLHSKPFLSSFLKAFSCFTHYFSLFNTSSLLVSLPSSSSPSHSDSPQFQLNFSSLVGIRVLSTFCVIFGHIFDSFFSGTSVIEYNYIVVMPLLTTVIAFSFEFVVDSFFWLSGFLGAYFACRQWISLQSTKKDPIHRPVLYWFLSIFHRYIRLTPTLALWMLILYTVLPVLSGPWYLMGYYKQVDYIANNWYSILTYTGTIDPNVSYDKLPFPWAWYLCNDFLYHCLLPLLLIIYFSSNRLRVFAHCLNLSLIIMSIIAGCLLTDHYRFVVGTPTPFSPPDSPQPTGDFPSIWYQRPWTRYPAFGIGVAAAWILFEAFPPMNKQGIPFYSPTQSFSRRLIRLFPHFWSRSFLFCLVGGIFLFDVFIIRDLYTLNPPVWTAAENLLYINFSRPFFVLALSLMFFLFAVPREAASFFSLGEISQARDSGISINLENRTNKEEINNSLKEPLMDHSIPINSANSSAAAPLPVAATPALPNTYYGGFVQSFLSCSFFVFLSKLTYQAYLCHFVLIFFYFCVQENFFPYSHLQTILLMMIGTFLAFSFGSASYFLLEAPIAYLQNRWLKGKK